MLAAAPTTNFDITIGCSPSTHVKPGSLQDPRQILQGPVTFLYRNFHIHWVDNPEPIREHLCSGIGPAGIDDHEHYREFLKLLIVFSSPSLGVWKMRRICVNPPRSYTQMFSRRRGLLRLLLEDEWRKNLLRTRKNLAVLRRVLSTEVGVGFALVMSGIALAAIRGALVALGGQSASWIDWAVPLCVLVGSGLLAHGILRRVCALWATLRLRSRRPNGYRLRMMGDVTRGGPRSGRPA